MNSMGYEKLPCQEKLCIMKYSLDKILNMVTLYLQLHRGNKTVAYTNINWLLSYTSEYIRVERSGVGMKGLYCTYKCLLCLWVSPNPRGARVRVVRCINTHFLHISCWVHSFILPSVVFDLLLYPFHPFLKEWE